MTGLAASTRELLVDTPNGSVFVTQIAGQDPPIVLMHGFPDDHHIYDRLLPLLPPKRAVVFDWQGYGRSERSELEGFSLAEHGGELDAVLTELEIERALLVGHDASGPDAVAFAIAHPQRVVHLVLLNTYFGHLPSLKLPEMIGLLAEPALAALADAMINDEAQRLWMLQFTADRMGVDAGDSEGVAARSILPQFFGGADHPDALVAIRAWTGRLFDSLREQDEFIESGALRDLEIPASIIFGETDPYLDSSLAQEIAELFTDSSLHIVPDASHWPQDDQPRAVAALLTDIASAQ